jgi:proteasome lid subunit RPN8/RPN11
VSTSFRLLLPRRLYDEMIAQARAELPNECCGLLAGKTVTNGPQRLAQVTHRYPLVNDLASPTEYLSEAKSMFAACRDIDTNGCEILAVYHSHPKSDPVPSKTDHERNYSPEVMNLIISLTSGEPQVRAWWLTEGEHHEADWRLLE